MDAFHDLARVHDHLIDNFNLEILKPEICSEGMSFESKPWTVQFGVIFVCNRQFDCQLESLHSTSVCYHNQAECNCRISIMNHLKIVSSVD